MISIPLNWLFAYNSVVLTGILVTNIVVVVRNSILDSKRLRTPPPQPNHGTGKDELEPPRSH